MTNMQGLLCLNKSNKDSKRTSTSSTMTMIMKPINPKNPDQQDQENQKELVIWDCGSPLYDSYELVSLTHLIERHFMILPMSLGGSKRFVARFISAPRGGAVGPAKIPITDAGSTKAANTWKRAVSKKIKASTRIFGLYKKIVPWKKY